MIGPWGLVHIKEHAQLYIRLGGRFFLRGFGIVGAGVWEFSHTNFEIFGFGEPYGQTVPATDQLWLWGFLHIQEDVKLHILSGGGAFPWSSWLYGAGL